jgi:hypothetical protein
MRIPMLVLCGMLAAACDVGGVRKDVDGGGGAAGDKPRPDNTDGGVGGGPMSCDPSGPDLEGCSCASTGEMRGCWPSSAPAGDRGMGQCSDGTQTCSGGGEFPAWGACTGAVTTCSACHDGDTRTCYTGPSATENVGTCKDGMQVCTNGAWPTDCPGEVLPTKEACNDALDHDCNHLPGCLDVFACANNPACQEQCKLDRSGCVCPQGSGDTATCPAGFVGITNGGSLTSPGTVECCPCSAADCTNAACCAETVCKGSSSCSGYTCNTLPASCNGQVNFDCDDFPEDCDEPCCPCSNCP